MIHEKYFFKALIILLVVFITATFSHAATAAICHALTTNEGRYGDIFRLTVSSGEYSDETVLRFKEDATVGFDHNLDAYKLLNTELSPSLFSFSDKISYSINSIPSGLSEKTISLTLIAGFAGTYTLTADFSQFEGTQGIWLEDRELATLLNLRENNEYSITVEQGTIEDRFFIQYKNQLPETVTANTDATIDNTIQISSYLQTIAVYFPAHTGTANIVVIDPFGKKVYEQENTDCSTGKTELTIQVTTGVYIVRVNTNQAITSRQVYLTK